MDITPQLLKDIRLSDSFRGYNKDEVDELIERVGAAIVQLQTRLRDALERADAAEARAAHAGPAPRSESEETLRRTLVLAQRTADAAIAEANAEAARTVAEANEHAARTVAEANERASRLLSDAEAQAAALRTETEAEVRRIAEESRGPLMEELRELERTRGFLRDDVELLERHLSTQRERLRGQVAELARLVDGDANLRVDPLPATSGIETPTAAPAGEAHAASIAPPTATVTPAFTAPAPAPVAPSPELATQATPMLEELAAAPLAAPDATRAAPGERAVAEPHWADDDLDLDDDDFADEPVPASSTPFLDQLRRAVDDDSGVDESAMSEFFGSDLDDNPRSRFGRRR